MELFWSILLSFTEVLVVGLLLGAGLPALYSGGVRLLAWSDGAVDGQGTKPAAIRRRARLGAYLIFAAVLAIVLLGISVIVADGLGL